MTIQNVAYLKKGKLKRGFICGKVASHQKEVQVFTGNYDDFASYKTLPLFRVALDEKQVWKLHEQAQNHAEAKLEKRLRKAVNHVSSEEGNH